MGRLLFVPPAVGAGDAVLIATDDAGATPADIVSAGGGPVVTGGVLHAASDGSLPRFLGPADATATLYALRLNYRGQVAGAPVTLTGVDLSLVAAPPGGSSPVATFSVAMTPIGIPVPAGDVQSVPIPWQPLGSYAGIVGTDMALDVDDPTIIHCAAGVYIGYLDILVGEDPAATDTLVLAAFPDPFPSSGAIPASCGPWPMLGASRGNNQFNWNWMGLLFASPTDFALQFFVYAVGTGIEIESVSTGGIDLRRIA